MMKKLCPIKYGVKVVAPTDPYAAYVVSQMRGGSLVNDETGKIWQTLTGTPQVSSTVSHPSGSGSALYFDGGASIGVPHTSDLNVGSQDSTMEFWMWCPNVNTGTVQQVIGKLGWEYGGSTFVEGASPQGNSTNGWRFQIYNDLIDYQEFGGDSNAKDYGVASGQWVHIEMGRKIASYAGTSHYLFVDGVLVDNQSTGTPYAIDQAISMVMGGPVRNNAYYVGYVANWRWTVGVCRHTADFTPETTLPTI